MAAQRLFAVMRWTNDNNRLSVHNLKYVCEPDKPISSFRPGDCGTAVFPGRWNFRILAVGGNQEMKEWLDENITELMENVNDEVHSVPVQEGGVTVGLEEELEIVSASETDLVYVGESLFGVKTSRKALERAEKTAKTAEKLALNLVEIVLAPEEIQQCTTYGNQQHNKRALEGNKRKALRSHILGKYDADWDKLVKIMNDEIRKLKKNDCENK